MTSAQQFARNLGNTVMFSFLAGFLAEKHKESLPFRVPSPAREGSSQQAAQPGRAYTRITFHL